MVHPLLRTCVLFFDDKVVSGTRAGPWKFYRHVDGYYWPAPLDRPDTLSGRRIAGYRYRDENSGREVRFIADDPMLYDLRVDPGEAYNVARRHPDVVAAALAHVENWEQDYFRNPRGWR